MTRLNLTSGAPYSGPLTTTKGTAADPAIAFGAPNVGLFCEDDQLSVAVNGAAVATFDQNGLTATSTIVGRSDPRGLDIVGWDGSLQFRVATNILAAEFLNVIGGVPTVGATLFADSDTSDNVDINIVPKGDGSVIIGNYFTKFLYVTPPNAIAVAPKLTLGGTDDGTIVSMVASAPAGYSGVPVVSLALVPQNGGALQLSVTDSTAVGGNARGSYATDLQSGRTSATQVAAGAYSFVVGYANAVSTNGGSAIGYGHLVNGRWSSMVGQNGNDKFRYGFQGFSTGIFAAQGDAQIGQTYFRGKSVSGAQVTLTADAAAQGANNCLNISAHSAAVLKFSLVGKDLTASGNACAWFQNGLLTRDTTAASTTLALATATTLGIAPTVVVTADTTNSGLLFKVTPGNSNTWDFVVKIDVAEVA